MANIDFNQLKKYSLIDSTLRDYQQENKLLYNIFSSLRYREPKVQPVERSLSQCDLPL